LLSSTDTGEAVVALSLSWLSDAAAEIGDMQSIIATFGDRRDNRVAVDGRPKQRNREAAVVNTRLRGTAA